MRILAIETSADETGAAVTEGRRVLSNVIFSQISTHTKWGGIYPALAKRAHEERIDWVLEQAESRYKKNKNKDSSINRKLEVGHPAGERLGNMQEIDYIAVTYGPGLAVALEVGIKKAKELAKQYNKKLIAVNHLEGHIYSSFVQNSKGHPVRDFQFPYLALIISGGHTEIVLWKDYLDFEVLGETLDDAAGEALDKAGKMLGLGYPAGPVIERLSQDVDNKDFYQFPRPMTKSPTLEFSFSGLKTSFYYFTLKMSEKEKQAKLKELVSSFQMAVFDTILHKVKLAMKQTNIHRLAVGGGVIANSFLRKQLRKLAQTQGGEAYFPPYNYLTGDNAAMIGVAAYYKAQKNQFINNIDELDRIPRLTLA